MAYHRVFLRWVWFHNVIDIKNVAAGKQHAITNVIFA